MKVSVVVFPGSNCDHDMVYTYGTLLGADVTTIWHRERALGSPDLVVIPGGFSYGDYLRTGALARLSPVMEEVIAFAKRGGAVLGPARAWSGRPLPGGRRGGGRRRGGRGARVCEVAATHRRRPAGPSRRTPHVDPRRHRPLAHQSIRATDAPPSANAAACSGGGGGGAAGAGTRSPAL